MTYKITIEKRVDKEYEDVREFHRKFDQLDPGPTITHLTYRKLRERINCMLEELDEFDVGMSENQDMLKMADALIDLVYFAKGTAAMMGLPWADLWDDVQRANMAKVPGTTHRGNLVDVAKPPGWVGPHTEEILKLHGYNRAVFTFYGTNEVDEDKCLDDLAHLEANNP
jgi:predicted HAD superfamily Cof-like phosphohydrolase